MQGQVYSRTDRQIGKKMNRWTDGRTIDRWTKAHLDRWTDRQVQTDKWAGKQTDGQINRRTEKQIHKLIDSQTNIMGKRQLDILKIVRRGLIVQKVFRYSGSRDYLSNDLQDVEAKIFFLNVATNHGRSLLLFGIFQM